MKTLAAITLRANEQGLELLLAGGHAVIIHGHQRTTFDTGLVIHRSDRERWLELMNQRGFELFFDGPAFIQLTPKSENHTAVDLMMVNESTFAQLKAKAVSTADSSSPRVIALPHLIAMKCHAIRHGHAGRLGKDMDDVIQLFKINKLNPADAGRTRLHFVSTSG